MSALADVYIKTETLETLLKTVKTKGEKGIAITVSISERTNDYGQNVTSFVSQTKEQREAKKDKFYVGNGKVFWTDGTISKAEAKDSKPTPSVPQYESTDDELPF